MQIQIVPPSDFSFTETLAAHGWRRLLPFVWQEEMQILERSEEMPKGNVVRLRLRGDAREILVEVEGNADETEIIRRVHRMLQIDVPMNGFHAYCLAHPRLASIAVSRQGRMLRCPTLWEDVVKVIATTNTTWAQTIAMTVRLTTQFGAEGQAFPTPERIAALPLEEFAAKARMGYRSAYVHKIATEITGGRLDLEAWQADGLTADAFRKRLLSLPGIGPYGAACLMLYLGRPEHVNVDSWARMLLSKELGRPVSDKEVHTFFAGYGEWSGLIYNFYPWNNS